MSEIHEMREMDDAMPWRSEDDAPKLSEPLAVAPEGGDGASAYLATPRPAPPLVETATYRPGALVAVIFLVPPVASALVLAIAIWAMGGAPFWAPLLLLLWLPLELAGLLLLRGVRLTREHIALGRPLGPWRVIPFAEITLLEARGPRLVISAGSPTRRISFAPALLSRGGQLRRQLLLSLPQKSLAGDARAEAAFLLEGAFPESGAEDALAVRAPLLTPGLAALAALALGAGAVLAAQFHHGWLAVTLGMGVALAVLAALWLSQELVINEQGFTARLTRRLETAHVSWDELTSITRAPGELALLLRGHHAYICPGPGALSARDARRVRQIISYYVRERGLMTAPRAQR